MPYIGNTIRAADDYRLIDDISSSFNGSTTSFALQVAGSAPVPFPKSPQQVLISVNGVIQEPDPTGASGFNLVGTNIVFSSAPTNGHAFFGIIYATADYLNSGGNFPSGSTGSPSLTFIGDEDTGIYRKGSGSVGFVSNSTEIANTDSNGITISSGNLILGDSSGASDDRIKLGASGDLQIYHNSNNSFIENSTGNLHIKGKAGEESIVAIPDGAVELYYDNSKKLETTSSGVTISGGTVANGHITLPDHTGSQDGKLRFGASTDFEIFHNGTSNNTEVNHTTNTGHLQITSNRLKLMNYDGPETYIDCISNGAVELYHNNTKRFETGSLGVRFFGNLYADDSEKIILGSGTDLEIFHDGTASRLHSASHPFYIRSGGQFGVFKGDGTESIITGTPDAAVDLYYNNVKRLETTSTGVHISTRLDVKEITRTDGVGTYGTMGGIHFSTKSVLPMDSSGNVINNDIELGSSSYRWKNIYTNDLHLSNEGSSNDVDSTWGNYTIQEGFEDLFLINHRTGKKFKFNLTEVG